MPLNFNAGRLIRPLHAAFQRGTEDLGVNKQRDVKSSAKQPTHTEPSGSRANRSLHSQHTEGQLQDHLLLKRRMRPYVNRVRFNILDFTHRELGATRERMESILITMKIPPVEARDAVIETLNIAANYCLEPMRRSGNLNEHKRAIRRLHSLIRLIEAFEQRVSKLPPGSKGKLNRILAKQDLRNFDSEAFIELFRDIIHELSRVSPAVVAGRARSMLIEAGIKAANDPALAQILQTAPPKIIELWETVPAQTRAQVEADVRSFPRCKSVVEFLRRLAKALKKSRPQAQRGPKPAIERSFVLQVNAIWRRLGLKAGRAYLPDKERYTPSRFQQYCHLALTAVGNKSRISARQVTNLRRRTIPRKP
jgi:hypothetical protein